jgi:hypothetical protein
MAGVTASLFSPAAAGPGALAHAAPTARHAHAKPTIPLRVIMIASSPAPESGSNGLRAATVNR